MKKTVILMSIVLAAFSAVSFASGNAEAGGAKTAAFMGCAGAEGDMGGGVDP